MWRRRTRRRTPDDTDAFTPSRTARTYQHDIAIHGCMHECMPTLIGCTIIVASRGATRELATAQQIDMSKLSCIRTHTLGHTRELKLATAQQIDMSKLSCIRIYI